MATGSAVCERLKRRYAPAYAVARLLKKLRLVIAVLSAAAIVFCLAMGVGGGLGSAIYLVFVPTFVFIGLGAWFLLDALAAFLRVAVDIAIGVAPGISDDEKLGLLN